MKNVKQRIGKLITLFTLLAVTTIITQVNAKQVKASQAELTDIKILMVVSGYGQGAEPAGEQSKEKANGKELNKREERPGYEFDEFAKAYSVFKENGIAIDIASPNGGKVEADKFDPNKPYNAKVLADKTIMAQLNNTIGTSVLDANDYDAVFVVGGKGAMFDLPNDTALQKLIAQIYQNQGIVSAVCHGPAAFVNVKLDDGSYLVANKAINSFTNEEEMLFGKKWLSKFEFLLEDKLVERGAKFQSSQIMLSHVAIDDRLITGQNPTSTVDVANALVKHLGMTPVKADMDIEDKTLAVVAKFLSGDTAALNVLTSALSGSDDQAEQTPGQYHLPLVGMYGFYYHKNAKTTREFEQSLTLMSAAQKAINNPRLDMEIAKIQSKLGQTTKAKATLQQLLAGNPDFKPAQDMLKAL